MIIKLYNRLGIEKGSYIYPENVFCIDGYREDCVEECSILERYVEKRIQEIQLLLKEPVKIQVNGGLNFALVAALNTFKRLNIDIYVGYYNKETRDYFYQFVEAQSGEVDENKKIAGFQTILGRHPVKEKAIYEGECVDGTALKKELLFDFKLLEEAADQKIRSCDAGTIIFYCTGLSQCMVSVIKVCRKLGKKLIIKHRNTCTDEYFVQECA